MANHKSALKRARQDKKVRERNLSTKNAVRTAEKKIRKAVSAKDKSEADVLLVNYMSKMDKATSKGVFNKATASRKVSRLSKLTAQI